MTSGETAALAQARADLSRARTILRLRRPKLRQALEAMTQAVELETSVLRRILPRMSEIVTQKELRELSDDELVRLIEERSNLRDDAAREALAIIRGDGGDIVEVVD